MSTLSDYKSYKKYLPEYEPWKYNRDLQNAKRHEYLKQTGNISANDAEKSKVLLKAIDVMDEFSQQRAEDMEVATEQVVGQGLEIAMLAGAGLGFLMSKLEPYKRLVEKAAKGNKKISTIIQLIPTGIGMILGTVVAFPLYSWAAKAEVKASKRGRFEAMRNVLNDPKTFAIPTEEQGQILDDKVKDIKLTKKEKKKLKNSSKGVGGLEGLKEMAFDSKEYLAQRQAFDMSIEADKQFWNEKLSKEEIEKAKQDQQLLTKIVEKVDIASQDYAENAELATGTLTTIMFGSGSLLTLLYNKVAQKLHIGGTKIVGILSFAAMLGVSIFSAKIQKQAARVGRYKVKQDLMAHPEMLTYVSDEKTGEIKDVEVDQTKKEGIFKFLKHVWKDNKEYNKWEETAGIKEKLIMEEKKKMEFSEDQIKEAKRLQKNTFKTFNKVDENSQKYSESVEALGLAIQYPIVMLCTILGVAIGSKFLIKAAGSKDAAQRISGFMKYMFTILLSTLPSIGINAYITKEQKKASRIADMLAIKELDDYRNFADYSKFYSKEVNKV